MSKQYSLNCLKYECIAPIPEIAKTVKKKTKSWLLTLKKLHFDQPDSEGEIDTVSIFQKSNIYSQNTKHIFVTRHGIKIFEVENTRKKM